eukprot:COSAG05_NODE_3925_length_1772_cov_34.933652_1_plen_104_part_00
MQLGSFVTRGAYASGLVQKADASGEGQVSLGELRKLLGSAQGEQPPAAPRQPQGSDAKKKAGKKKGGWLDKLSRGFEHLTNKIKKLPRKKKKSRDARAPHDDV